MNFEQTVYTVENTWVDKPGENTGELHPVTGGMAAITVLEWELGELLTDYFENDIETPIFFKNRADAEKRRTKMIAAEEV
tara:strand:+ start:148 stop:387 length:240 start_codon:yes stop_codon:yes gene_type:complete